MAKAEGRVGLVATHEDRPRPGRQGCFGVLSSQELDAGHRFGAGRVVGQDDGVEQTDEQELGVRPHSLFQSRRGSQRIVVPQVALDLRANVSDIGHERAACKADQRFHLPPRRSPFDRGLQVRTGPPTSQLLNQTIRLRRMIRLASQKEAQRVEQRIRDRRQAGW